MFGYVSVEFIIGMPNDEQKLLFGYSGLHGFQQRFKSVPKRAGRVVVYKARSIDR